MDSNAVQIPVYEKIKALVLEKGIPETFVLETFKIEGLEIQQSILDKFAEPQEKKTWEEYKGIFINSQRIESGKNFYFNHKTVLEQISQKWVVDPYLIVSIVGVESNYGTQIMKYTVFNSLYTQIAAMKNREQWAIKEMVEFLKYCYTDSIAPHSIMGSYAGAFGYGQFIPSSFNHYAVDFNGDGKREPDNWADVFASIANYLKLNGYPGKKVISAEEQNRKVYKSIYAYNRSDNYVKAVLELKMELEKMLRSELDEKL